MKYALLSVVLVSVFIGSFAFARAQTARSGISDTVLAQLASVLESLRDQVEQLSRLVALKIIQSPGSGVKSPANNSVSPSLKPTTQGGVTPEQTSQPAGTSVPGTASAPAASRSAVQGQFTTPLRLGDTGIAVDLLQAELIRLGYLESENRSATPNEARFGIATQTAVKVLQSINILKLKELGLPQSVTPDQFTGVVGRLTNILLKAGALPNPNGPAAQGTSAQLQALISAGVPVTGRPSCNRFAAGSVQRTVCETLTTPQ